jgi:ornithine carbamoyltransferase
MRHYLSVDDLSPSELGAMLDLAVELKADPTSRVEALRGRSIALIFEKPSTRTRVSFEVGVVQLGAHPVVLSAAELQLGRGETIQDTGRVLSRYVDAIVLRTFEQERLEVLATTATVPIVNALSDFEHPCQALADLLTLRERLGDLSGRALAYLGDGNNVAHSLLEACALAGVDIAVATPPGFEADLEVVETAERLATQSGSIVRTTHDPLVAAAGATAVYTDVWLSMGDDEDERAARLTALQPYQVNQAVMAEADPSAVFMHCLPAHRGEEVAAAVIDGPASVVLDEAENRMHTAQALLHALIVGDLEGASVTEVS